MTRTIFAALTILAIVSPQLFAAEPATKPSYPPHAAQQAVDTAFAKASSDGKVVFMKSGYPECGWCNIFDRYHAMPEVKQIVEKYYVVVKIDTSYMPDGKEVFTKFAEPGSPSWVIVGADRKPIIDSYDNGNNVGYPYEPNEVAHYVKALRQASPAISDAEIETLKEKLAQAAKKTQASQENRAPSPRTAAPAATTVR
jgi:uncharacterized protein YyaL (SSP411 family)